MIHIAPLVPVIHVIDRRIENTVKIANPRVNILTRPKMSPTRPKLTTRTEVTSKKPFKIHKKYGVFEGDKVGQRDQQNRAVDRGEKDAQRRVGERNPFVVITVHWCAALGEGG
jgi:hypothetical protein